jgi:hypothetical protein
MKKIPKHRNKIPGNHDSNSFFFLQAKPNEITAITAKNV